MQDPLSTLQPILLPPAISWWPPAPGWWVVLLLLLMLSIFSWRLRTQKRPQKAVLKALSKLKHTDTPHQQQLTTINQLMKRYILHCWNDPTVAQLCGSRWLTFLDRHSHNSGFIEGAGKLLQNHPYQTEESANGLSHEEVNQLILLCQQWIQSNPPHKSLRGNR
ncbi:MAG: DUF4381 domain-containing protein [Gammaproteobacteria bacterium]|jgi:hypothetical protein|nr:DUF4381 domain-containing protein [Gammaproteobacteria bacterium]MBT3488387.1 DUF4381 domain-containing protein [Gammaproteobacteria bacterium]MBT3719620.1 DUF4381 domain-containing protein [Gammaproteobacteria bacterium]MBT3845060.1 DUF4381 domain-containing protein [Gammaproteobacteria bacterium]MBT3892379.1 DUF4381 domain-containing protein [Gammaproteobacteria bacterium]